MLILSRKPGDAILIDGGIRVVVLACDGSGVRLGIEAPAAIGIVREEIAPDVAHRKTRAGTTPRHPPLIESVDAVDRSESSVPGRDPKTS